MRGFFKKVKYSAGICNFSNKKSRPRFFEKKEQRIQKDRGYYRLKGRWKREKWGVKCYDMVPDRGDRGLFII
jgi:hypothetical protein